MKKDIKVGIGFATGRSSFQEVLNAYVYNWEESGLTDIEHVSLDLFVAYDLKYAKTKPHHYRNIKKDVRGLIDDVHFIGSSFVQDEISRLLKKNVITQDEARLFFGKGYAAQRNSILYAAMKSGVDYLLFLDDDEYPMAVTKNYVLPIWSGQEVLMTHLTNIWKADITNGYHCGYISPIPYVEFNDVLKEDDFRLFIKAISNEVINWDSIRSVMKNGGVTYADTRVLTENTVDEVSEVSGTKFITGANLCINLTDPERVYPFYNPPGARGEDTFLSTCLGKSTVLRVPCYTFHDGFLTYKHLTDGVLPTRLKYIEANSPEIIERFYKACIGWIRYKPLYLYITQRNDYDSKIAETRELLSSTLDKICTYFGKKDFTNIITELEYYNENVEKHYDSFLQTQQIWAKLSKHISE